MGWGPIGLRTAVWVVGTFYDRSDARATDDFVIASEWILDIERNVGATSGSARERGHFKRGVVSEIQPDRFAGGDGLHELPGQRNGTFVQSEPRQAQRTVVDRGPARIGLDRLAQTFEDR